MLLLGALLIGVYITTSEAGCSTSECVCVCVCVCVCLCVCEGGG